MGRTPSETPAVAEPAAGPEAVVEPEQVAPGSEVPAAALPEGDDG